MLAGHGLRIGLRPPTQCIQRLLAFEPERFNFAEMEDVPAPEYDGRALRLALYFTLQDVAARATI